MSLLKVARHCALLVPIAVGCGGVAGEPNAGDAASSGETRPTTGRDSGSGRLEASTADGAHDAKPDAQGHPGLDGGSPEAEAGPRDHGEASTTYPAFTPWMPQVQYSGGPVLTNAEIVTVTWYGDPNASTFEAFGDDLGTSDYWAETTSEYKVGVAHSGPTNHLRLPESEAPIASWAYADVGAWVATHAQSSGIYGWPAPNSNTLYTLYLSPQSDVLINGSSACGQSYGGYHDSTVVNGSDVAYAVVLQCDGGLGAQTSSLASHELIEAATDPHPFDIGAWDGFDENHLAWHIFGGYQADEVGDACEFYFDAYFTPTFSVVETLDAGAGGGDAGILYDAGLTSFSVTRIWSNANAAAGHAPCRPSDYSTYFNVSPLQMDPSVSVNLTSQGGVANTQGQGYRIAKGATRTFPVGFWSDGPTNGPWTISASEGSPVLGGSQTSHLTISIDKTQGQNGDISYVSVTVNEIDTSINGELVTIASELSGFHRTFMPILISNE
jgi:hypothetical protein